MATTETAAATAATKRKRVSTYDAKITFRLTFDDDAQGQIDKRKKIEEFAASLGAVDLVGTGHYGSTMIDVPK